MVQGMDIDVTREGESQAEAGSVLSARDCVEAVETGGCSVVLRAAGSRWPAISKIQDALEDTFGLPAGANVYWTPAGGWLEAQDSLCGSLCDSDTSGRLSEAQWDSQWDSQ